MSKILVTGGFGFIGSHLVKMFSKEHQVIIYGIDSKERNSLRYFENETHKENITHICGSILDTDKLNFALRDNIDVVIHCAAIAGVSNYFKYPVSTVVTNGIGTYNVIDLCFKNNIKKTINISSSEAYGISLLTHEVDGQIVFDSSHNHRLTYSIGKLFGDQLVTAYHKQHNMNVCSIRPFGIWGPGQLGEGFLQIAIRKAIKNEDIPIVGDGKQTRDWCYIDDFVNAIDMCTNLDPHYAKDVSGKIINVGDPRSYDTIINTARSIVDILQSKSKFTFVERKNVIDTPVRKSNIKTANDILEWKPRASFEKSVIETAEWYRNNQVDCENISF
jgi:nucleoside-diphosphate-sugar epimerase